MAIVALTLLLAAVFGIGLFAGGQWRSGTGPTATVPALTGTDLDKVREAVVARVSPAIVQVNVLTQNGGGIGSGVIIDQRGYIVTNNHVVNGAQTIQVVLYDGTKVSAQLADTGEHGGCHSGRFNAVACGSGGAGHWQFTGITQTVTNGIVSALGRTISEGQGVATISDVIQTDAPINPGNSGGALVDLQGNLVGIPTLAAIDPEFNTPANGVGFAIPSNRVKSVVAQIIKTG